MVLPYIDMNQPRVYTCSPSWVPLSPPSPSHTSGSSQCTSTKHPAPCIEPGLAIHFTYDNVHVSMPFSQIFPPLPSSAECKRLFYTSVSFAVLLTWLSLSFLYSGSWWWTGRLGVLRFMGSQRVRHDWATDLIWSDLILYWCFSFWLTSLCIIGSSFSTS